LTRPLIEWAYRQANVELPTLVRTFTDLDDWSKGDMIKQHCIWSLSPTVARQALTTAALAWAESPLDSSHLFIVPRIMQRDFGRVNRHILYLGQYDPKELPFLTNHPSRVPLLVFFLPPHRRSLITKPAPRLDLSSFPRMPTWVARQVAYMRGLS
jgi:hypothetical protein